MTKCHPSIGAEGGAGAAGHPSGGWEVLYTTVPGATLHYTTLHYTTLHYTTLHYTTLNYTTGCVGWYSV